MPTKSVKPESEMTTEEFLESLKEVQPQDKKKPKTIREHEKEKGGGILGSYFGKRKKIMEELDK